MTALTEHTPGVIWTADYPVHYAGIDLTARMTIIRLKGGRLLLHSPCEIDSALKDKVEALGTPAYIVAPGSYHYFHVPSAQAAFPEAETWICPGIERKRPEMEFDWILSDRPPEAWAGEIDQVLVRGTRLIWEVAFFHKASKTLILVDLIENIGDATPNTDWQLKFWWKVVFHMWNKPRPAPEYQLGWKDKAAARASLARILEWDFTRIIIAHGESIEKNAKQAARDAWAVPLAES